MLKQLKVHIWADVFKKNALKENFFVYDMIPLVLFNSFEVSSIVLQCKTNKI